jgi:hypothetical protein
VTLDHDRANIFDSFFGFGKFGNRSSPIQRDSEMLLQIPELLDHDQPAATGPDLLPLEYPRMGMWYEHRV